MADTDNIPQPKTIFVTGAETGTGRVLIRELVKRGYKVVGATDNGTAGAYSVRRDGGIPVYPDFRRQGEIESALALAHPAAIVHLAGLDVNEIPHIPANRQAYTDMLQVGTQNLMKAAAKFHVGRVIVASFAFLYGDKHNASVDESAALSSDNAFFKAAIASEKAALEHGAIVLRAGFVYGGNSANTQSLLDHLRHGRAVAGGKGAAGWIHEADLAHAILALIERDELPTERVFNVVDDSPVSCDAFINQLGQALGVGQPLQLPSWLTAFRADALQTAVMNVAAKPSNALAKQVLGWQPTYSNQNAGIEQMLLIWRATENQPEMSLDAPPVPDAIALSMKARALPTATASEAAPVAEAVKAAAPVAEAAKPAVAKAAVPAGAAPWTQTHEEREKSKQAALARKAARAAKRAAG